MAPNTSARRAGAPGLARRLSHYALSVALLLALLPVAPAPLGPTPAHAARDPLPLAWSSSKSDDTNSLAWGDVDGDGDLDLAVGGAGRSRLYRNDNGVLTPSVVWFSSESDGTQSIAWGDVDGDGDLDLAVGNLGRPNRLYRNDNGALTPSAVWSTSESDSTTSVAWGDVDGDGDLDLAVGNRDLSDLQPTNRLYRNDSGVLTPSAVWSSSETGASLSLAWGDVDGDDDLDLAVGNFFEPNRLYRNDNGALTLDTSWTPASRDTSSVAWGDVDGDGDLDLAVGNNLQPNQLYRNDGGVLTPSAVWSSSEMDHTSSVAWSDLDGDSDLDLAVGNRTEPNRLYRNDNGVLTPSAVWSTSESDYTNSLAWGDVDGDGDLDLAVSNNGPNRLYRNDNSLLSPDAAWFFAEQADNSYSLAWGDVDGDGDLDLAIGNLGQPNRLYRNDGGVLTLGAVWSSDESDNTYSIAWGDVDDDGDLDLAVGNSPHYNEVTKVYEGGQDRLYRNDNGVLTPSAAWSSSESDNTNSLAWGDVDGDGDPDLAIGNASQPNRLYRNDNGVLTPSAVWSSSESDNTTSLAWGDVDNDGDLDLAAGNSGQPNRLYRNELGTLSLDTGWTPESRFTSSVAWGDVDGDGDLDLAVGNNYYGNGQANQLYRNDNGTLTPSAVWSSSESDNTTSLAWGDVDGDGDLDLAVGNSGQPNRLYRNDNGVLTPSAVWSSSESDWSYSVAWGDIEGDGDLDLATGNSYRPNRLYRNDSGVLTPSAAWSSSECNDPLGIAWGDVDGDGDLDLAVGNSNQPNRLYRNDSGSILPDEVWFSSENDVTTSVAWGDVDSDGDLDLAVGNASQPNRLYRNDNGVLTPSAVWSSSEADSTTSVAWGDVDGDGDLDLAVGNGRNVRQPNRLYRNDNGVLTPSAVWSSSEADSTTSVAWGDVDGDGDLDLAVGNSPFYNAVTPAFEGGQNRLYRNDNGVLTQNAVWSSSEAEVTTSIAWGDVDGDGDLDLAVGNGGQQNRLYRNDGSDYQGVPHMTLAWSSIESDATNGLAWGDADGDGDLDLAVSNDGPNQLYRNENGTLTPGAAWSSSESDWSYSLAWGDVDGDGDLDLAVGNRWSNRIYRNEAAGPSHLTSDMPGLALGRPGSTANAGFYSSPEIQAAQLIRIPYTLRDAEGDPVRQLRAEFSLDGGGTWRPAIAASGAATTNLSADSAGVAHTFVWDTFASGLFGQSDNVVIRMVAYPSLSSGKNGVPLFQRPHTSATSFPFRVRGTQVRVVDQDGKGVPAAQVYRLPQGSAPAVRFPALDADRMQFATDARGYLQGQGALSIGDQLLALQPISSSAKFDLFASSAAPSNSGLLAQSVVGSGVQTLTVSLDHPLILFKLGVSLEWDARNDTQFMAQLQRDLQRTSELLYDWSDGQAALGAVTIYQDKLRWGDVFDAQEQITIPAADIQIYASNRLRPNAAQGGITPPNTRRADPNASTNIVYEPGQVRMSAAWNRYGDSSGTLGEDWPRTLAHELGHYALYLDDNYLGLDASKQIIALDQCRGAMSDPYREDWSEFQPAGDEWDSQCARSLSEQITGRADWQTIVAMYPGLRAPAAFNTLSGPTTFPLPLTTITVVAPSAPASTLLDPAFSLTVPGAAGDLPQVYVPAAGARAVLYTSGDQRAIDLGTPATGQILARGASAGDRLCVYDSGAQVAGCTTISAGSRQISLARAPTWRPDLRLTPVHTRTLTIRLAADGLGQAPDSVVARVFPESGAATQTVTMRLAGGWYSGTLTRAPSEEPILGGLVRVTVSQGATQREVVADYSMGGDPAPGRGPEGAARPPPPPARPPAPGRAKPPTPPSRPMSSTPSRPRPGCPTRRPGACRWAWATT